MVLKNVGLNHEADLLGLPAQFGFNSGFHPCKESPSTFLSDVCHQMLLVYTLKSATNISLYQCSIMKLNRRLICSQCLSLLQTSLRVTTACYFIDRQPHGNQDHQNTSSCSQSSCQSCFMIQTSVLYLNTDYLHFYPLIYKKMFSLFYSLVFICLHSILYRFTNFNLF